ncbi:hypothetical protein Trydic_g13959 [Trypoxylus dichotomus]
MCDEVSICLYSKRYGVYAVEQDGDTLYRFTRFRCCGGIPTAAGEDWRSRRVGSDCMLSHGAALCVAMSCPSDSCVPSREVLPDGLEEISAS